nr:hypothetical protein [Tanacetum cinerariifolium]
MTTPNVTSSTNSQMHNNIVAAGSRDRPPMLAPGRYPQWPVDATDDSPAVPEHTIVETLINMSPENKAHFLAEKEVIRLVLTGIGDEIYSTVDACQTAQEMWEAIERLQQAQEMWEAIERLQQGESLNIQDVKTNLFCQCLISSTTSARMVKISHIYRQKGKEIAKPITPPSEIASEEDSDPEQAQRDKDMQKNLVLIAKYFKKIYKPTNNNLRTSSNSKNKNVDTTPQYKNDDQSGQFGSQRTVNVAAARENVGSKVVQQFGIQCFNCREYGHFVKECRKPVKDSAYHKEKMLLCKQAEQGVPLQAEQYDWLADTDEEVDEQELEVHYSYMAKIQEVPAADSSTYSELVEQNKQNDVESNDERVALANLKLDVDENKKIQKQLKKANTTLAQELKECKAILAETKIVDNAWIKHSKDQFCALTAQDMEILIQTCLMPLAIKTKNDSFKFVHELKQEMHTDLKYVESLEKKIDELESDKAKFSDMYDVILQECVSKDVMCSYLQSLSDLDALAELQYLKAQLQDKNIAISELKKLIEKGKGKSVDTKFDRPSVVRQPNAQRIPKPSVLGEPTPFSNSLERIYFPKTMSVSKANVSEGLSKPVTTQTLSQTAKKA